jgi:NAD-dependent dihydropyrimidine dehydrogenase PreA subunit
MDFLIMELLVENILIYSLVAILCVGTVLIYILKKRKESRIVDEKIRHAKEFGLHEPVSLHPYVDVNSCIQTGACISACPEKDIIGIRNGKATIINASQCIGHGACFLACPTQAISLRI